ncbi:AAA domain-containing protein [Actinomadura nitritigenes]|uniref:AAA domain-containing protein n=1 Tax=Actinomadura nitritigenes TaxID=134602 RepID=UPI0036BA1AFA
MSGAEERQIVDATRGLAAYLRDLVSAGNKPVLGWEAYEHVWWLKDGFGRGPRHRPDGLIAELQFEHAVPPALPEDLRGLVSGDLLDPDGEPRLRTTPEQETGRHNEHASRLPAPVHGHAPAGAPAGSAITRRFQTWLAGWRSWAERERNARPRRELYEALAAAQRQLSQNDDVVELVVAVGLFSWQPADGDPIQRHLLTCAAQIEFDPQTSRLRVSVPPEATPQLEDRFFLNRAHGLEPQRIETLRQDLEAGRPWILGEEVEQVLQQWAAKAMRSPVAFSATWQRPGAAGSPAEVSMAPALILRRRAANHLLTYYEHIHEALSGPQARSPLGLAQLLAPLEPQQRAAWRSSSAMRAEPILTEDPLYPLPANTAQREVFDLLRTDTALVVQGPPGTGKTHTIVNLLSALLAEGKRVLVTSAKDQALEVLFGPGMLPAPIQQLCVRVGHHRGSGQSAVERTITGLSDGTATRTLADLSREITDLRAQRHDLRRLVEHQRDRVGRIREAELAEHDTGAPGYAGTRAQIAGRVRDRRDRHGWIGELGALAAIEPPLTAAQARRLRELLVGLHGCPNRSRQSLLDPSTLPTAQQFTDLVAQANAVTAVHRAAGDLARRLATLDGEALQRMQRLADEITDALATMDMPIPAAAWSEDWRATALHDTLAGRNQALWQDLFTTTQAAQRAHNDLLTTWQHTVTLPPVSGAEQVTIEVMTRWRDHLAGGGRIKRLLPHAIQRDAQPILDRCTVDGQPPHTVPAVQIVLARLRAHAALTTLTARWGALDTQLQPGGRRQRTTPQTGRAATPQADLRVELQRLCDREADLRQIHRIGRAWKELAALVQQARIGQPMRTGAHWDLLTTSLAAVPDLHVAHAAARLLDELAALVRPGSDPAAEMTALAACIDPPDPARYPACLADLRTARDQQQRQREAARLFQPLHDQHPALADELWRTCTDPAWPQRLDELEAAWAWAAAARYLSAEARDRDHQAAEHDLDQAEHQLGKTTAALAAAQAWEHLLSRMTQAQRQALLAFKHRMSDLGKGTSRRYGSRYRTAVRQAMIQARQVVPAWIMPRDMIVETLPPQQDTFDVVIVDEASQLGVESLFLLWLAPHVIVVGDDKQCSPPPSSQGELEPIFNRLDDYLGEVSVESRDDFSPKSNLYKLLESRVPHRKRLTDHYRCMPEIIKWCSDNFYDGDLVPLRQYGANRLPPLRVEHVEDGYLEGSREQRRNPVEAKRIVEKLKELFDDPAYDGKTFGIITLHGGLQAKLLEKTLNQELPDMAIREARRLRVGSPEQFQGDQRDVILLSMVATDSPRALTGEAFEQRFNVAVSRAGDQLWLFTSVPAHRLKDTDLRHSLLMHMQTPPVSLTTPAELSDVTADTLHPQFDSLFEQRVFLKIRERGYRVVPHVSVGAKTIDMVVIGDDTRLAVECDGTYWHDRTPQQRRNDLLRERELRRAGWQFWRLGEGDFTLDADQALEPLWAMLADRHIHPVA